MISPNLLRSKVFWSAPEGVTEVDLYIVLSSDVFVSEFVLLVDPLGYTKYDVPSFKIYVGNTIDRLTLISEWNLNENGVAPNENLTLKLKRLEQCRIIHMVMKLPRLTRFNEDLDSESAPFLHLGRFRVFGHPFSSITPRTIDPAELRAYQAFTRMNSLYSRVPVSKSKKKMKEIDF